MNYSARLERLKSVMKTTHCCEAILIEQPINLFYLTGLELSAGKLVITSTDSCLFVDGRYYEQSQKQVLYPVRLLKDNVLEDWLFDSQIHQLGFDQNHSTYHAFLTLQRMSEKFKEKGYDLEILPLESPLNSLRLIKDEEEIACLRKAAQLGYQGYEWVKTLLEEGIKESDLAFELEFFWKKRGVSRLAFDSIIAFGPNSSMPHYRAGQTKLTLNTSVLIDIGLVLNHYHSDMTRVVFFGSPPPLIQTIYAVVEEAKAEAMALCGPGIFVGDLDRVAREVISSAGYGEYFTHSLGHCLGLEIHEPPIVRQTGPYKDMPLQAGMVMTIEPGIYLPNIGGVRLEDTILITDEGYEVLSNGYNSSFGE